MNGNFKILTKHNSVAELLQTMSSKISESESLDKKIRKKNVVPDNIVQYNYVDYSAVDHRLKLHLHLSILDADEREVLQLLLRVSQVFFFFSFFFLNLVEKFVTVLFI